MKPLEQILDRVWHAYSGEAAWQTVSDLSRFHRMQASPGYRRAADLVHRRLLDDGLQAEILSYPADEHTQFWAWPSFQEWDCNGAILHLVEPREQAGLLADFRACPISLIQRSAAFDGEAEVVALEQGEEDADYEGLDVAGKVVLTKGDLRRVWELAVARRGAIGILFDGMRYAAPVRPEGDLADARQYTSFWWQAGDVRCFGFVLTPRQGWQLRRLLKGDEPRSGGEPAPTVRVRAQVEARLYDGALEVVSATIPGETDQEIVVTAHLCHPQPSANDNASGAAAALEAARALHKLVADGTLAPPRRTIRFLWVPEMTGTFAYLAGHEDGLDRIVAGLNLDMVGQDQSQTGSSWLLERPPESAASFAPALLARLRDEMFSLKGMADVSPSLSGLGGYPLFRHAEVPFSGGSDHWILSDPSVGVPAPMLIQWPDRFYHTSADTPDRTDPHSLARAGTLAAAYAYWLASAGVDGVTWLGYEMAARFKRRAADVAQATVTGALAQDEAQALAGSLADLDRRLAFLLDRHQAALHTLDRLGPVECLLADLYAEAERVAQHELSWARGAVDLHAATLGLASLPGAPGEPPAGRSEEEQAAAGLVPARLLRGPVPLRSHLVRLDDDEREAWRQLLKARKGGEHRTLTELALFWADGARSILQIADLVELETGRRDVELLLAYFRLLEKLGFVSW
jgi:aminopeptidase YwaD